MSTAAWDLMGRAIKDYWLGNTAAALKVCSEFAGVEDYPVHLFFREGSLLPDLEQYALSLCRGRVLDVGAGAGCHSLALQRKQLEVTALDISPDAARVMRERGIAAVACCDINDFTAEPFDTILLLMNGIGMAGDLPGLRRFLKDIRRLLKPAGQILMDSADLRMLSDETNATDRFSLDDANYFGAIRYQIEYQGEPGDPFDWLYVDQRTLRKNAAVSGWNCQVIFQEGCQYLARLTQPAPDVRGNSQ